MPSSNIYSNCYVDFRRTFSDPDLFDLVVYEFTGMIKKNITSLDKAFDGFICASINGVVLATAISNYFDKPICYLNNVGPKAMINNKSVFDKVDSDKKYIYIFDFMCLGMEYTRMDLICKAKGAEIICACGLSHYIKTPAINDGKKYLRCEAPDTISAPIYTLFGINDFEPKYYQCFFDKYDGIK